MLARGGAEPPKPLLISIRGLSPPSPLHGTPASYGCRYSSTLSKCLVSKEYLKYLDIHSMEFKTQIQYNFYSMILFRDMLLFHFNVSRNREGV